MEAIPITRGHQLACYTRMFRKLGSPVEAGLRRARLPTYFEDELDAWLPYERARRFTADMACRDGIPALGLLELSSDPQKLFRPSLRDPILGAPTLKRALQTLLTVYGQQLTHCKAWLEPAGDQVRFCFVIPLFQDVPGHDIGETRTVRLIERVVSAFAGPRFMPTRVLLASRARDLKFDLENAYAGVPVCTDQPYGAIEFPRILLSKTRRSAVPHPAISGVPAADGAPAASFAESLELILGTYLAEGHPHIGLAAEIVGCSVRTLQRRLKEDQTTYSGVVDNARCRAALARLRDPDIGFARLARELGYSEHSALTRAFRRWTGMSPVEYRRQCADPSIPARPI